MDLIKRAEILLGNDLNEQQKEYLLEDTKMNSSRVWQRRTGASTAVVLASILYAQDNPGASVLLVADTVDAAKFTLKKNLERLVYSNESPDFEIESSNFGEVNFNNGSKIYFSSINKDVVGKTIDLVMFDSGMVNDGIELQEKYLAMKIPTKINLGVDVAA